MSGFRTGKVRDQVCKNPGALRSWINAQNFLQDIHESDQLAGSQQSQKGIQPLGRGRGGEGRAGTLTRASTKALPRVLEPSGNVKVTEQRRIHKHSPLPTLGQYTRPCRKGGKEILEFLSSVKPRTLPSIP